MTVFNQPTQTLATLTIGGSILFQPILGKAIDRLGEKTVICMEAILLILSAWVRLASSSSQRWPFC